MFSSSNLFYKKVLISKTRNYSHDLHLNRMNFRGIPNLDYNIPSCKAKYCLTHTPIFLPGFAGIYNVQAISILYIYGYVQHTASMIDENFRADNSSRLNIYNAFRLWTKLLFARECAEHTAYIPPVYCLERCVNINTSNKYHIIVLF